MRPRENLKNETKRKHTKTNKQTYETNIRNKHTKQNETKQTDIVLHFTSKASETMRDRFLRCPKTIKRCLREKKFWPNLGGRRLLSPQRLRLGIEKQLLISSHFFPNRSTIARRAFRFARGHRSAQDTSLACLSDSVGLHLSPMDGNGELPLAGAIHRTKPKPGWRTLTSPSFGPHFGLELSFTAWQRASVFT